MKQVPPLDVVRRSVTMLGLDPNKYTLTSTEVVAAALRRAAGFLCPCAGSTLIRSVIEPMRGLIEDMETVTILVENTLEELVALGDLLEYHDLMNSASVVLYAAPCAFIARASGSVMLIGISDDQLSALPTDLESRIETSGCIRAIQPLPDEDLRGDLLQSGLIEISYDRWIKGPRRQTAELFVAHCDRCLQTKPTSGDMPGLLILDPALPVHFYRGRWCEPAGKSGHFVARRNQAYGSPLWCYVDLKNGQPLHLLDFPAAHSQWRGCDEAWHLQMAIDAHRGKPQAFGIRNYSGGKQDLLVYSPIPMWAQRRWDAIGERVDAQRCLMAFRFHDSEIEEEGQFARSSMWLEQTLDLR